MRAFVRGTPPLELERTHADATERLVARRKKDPAAGFRWPEYEGESILPAVRRRLGDLTNEHCSYCDGYPIDAQAVEEVDHFKPHSEFPGEAYSWANLYLSCTACNRAKLAQWSQNLLRPDSPHFTFSRYFIVNALTGDLEPNPAASQADRTRARQTIKMLDLCRPGLASERLRTLKRRLRGALDDDNPPYRFLLE